VDGRLSLDKLEESTIFYSAALNMVAISGETSEETGQEFEEI
jgi:uncharacterized protein (UPF0210 family)